MAAHLVLNRDGDLDQPERYFLARSTHGGGASNLTIPTEYLPFSTKFAQTSNFGINFGICP